jgi:hypothetical protein
MYILTKYRLILTKDTKDKPNLSWGRAGRSGTALARTRRTVNYRPVLSSERALQNNKPQLSKRKSQGERKIGHGSQMGAWHQDGLNDWLSVVMWLWLRLGWNPACWKWRGSRKRRHNREPSALGNNWATLFLGDINTGTWPSWFGESEMRQ